MRLLSLLTQHVNLNFKVPSLMKPATGGYTVATGISSATATAPTVTLKTSTTKVLTGNTTGTVTVY